jgi:hypothetical protein
MASFRQLGPILLLVLLLAIEVSARETIDRIVATVNGTAILQSEVDEAIRVELLLDGQSLDSATPVQQQAVLERVIEQELLRQEMGDAFPLPAAKEISDRLQQVRAQLPIAATQDDWRSLLNRYGLTESDMAERIAAQMQITKFVESRLQPRVEISRAAVRAYYNDKLLPELRQRGVQPEPPLSEVSEQIVEILRQQQVNDLLASWLQSLRQQSHIRMNPLPEPAVGGSPKERGPDAGQSGK